MVFVKAPVATDCAKMRSESRSMKRKALVSSTITKIMNLLTVVLVLPVMPELENTAFHALDFRYGFDTAATVPLGLETVLF
jgi:hypothetical protein